MGNEMFQARLNDDFAEEVHEYREEKHMSKSETVRHGLRLLVDVDDIEDGDRDTDGEEDAEWDDVMAAPSPARQTRVVLLVLWTLTVFFAGGQIL